MGKAYNRMPWSIYTVLAASTVCLLAVTTTDPVLGQQVNQLRGPAGCVPISERKMELGCYVVTADALGELPRKQLYWQIKSYPTRSAAEAAKEARGTVVEALDQIWLMTTAEADYRPTGGTHIAEIGPLLTKTGTKYTATYMQGIMMPGADTPVHYHPGPEALYTLAGEECMETTEGKFVSRPGGSVRSRARAPGRVRFG